MGVARSRQLLFTLLALSLTFGSIVPLLTIKTSALLDGSNDEIRPPGVCEHCNENRTCAGLLEKDPTLLDDCLREPTLQKCHMVCADHPEPTAMHVNVTDSTCEGHPMFWPGLDQGQWVKDYSYCNPLQGTPQECLLQKYRWKVSGCSPFETFDREKACSLLWQHNISDIQVLGDSLMRHVWQGLVLVLSGDFDYNVTLKHGRFCQGENGFADSSCRVGDGVMIPLCIQESTNASIHVQYVVVGPQSKGGTKFSITPVPNRGKTLYLYGIGNHALSRNAKYSDRLAILNAEAYANHFHWSNLSEPYYWGEDGHHLIWIPPHYKLSISRFDESNQRALDFMKESHDILSNVRHTGTLNTYSLTREALAFFCRSCEGTISNSNGRFPKCKYFVRDACEETRETWDGYHFGRGINTWKAHLALGHLQNTLKARQ
jgi:hypothetical protein